MPCLCGSLSLVRPWMKCKQHLQHLKSSIIKVQTRSLFYNGEKVSMWSLSHPTNTLLQAYPVPGTGYQVPGAWKTQVN